AKVIGEQLFNLVDVDGVRKVVLDLENLENLSSTGIGIIREFMFKLRAVGGRLVLCMLDPQLYEAFEITKYDKIFVIVPATAEAFATLERDARASCPVGGCVGWTRPLDLFRFPFTSSEQTCLTCGARFTFLVRLPAPGEEKVEVSSVSLPT